MVPVGIYVHHAPPGPISWIVIAVSFTCLFSFEVLCAVKLGIYHVGIIHLSADTPCTEYKLLTILNDLLIFFSNCACITSQSFGGERVHVNNVARRTFIYVPIVCFTTLLVQKEFWLGRVTS